MVNRELTERQAEVLADVGGIARRIQEILEEVGQLRELQKAAVKGAVIEGVRGLLVAERSGRTPGWASQIANDRDVPSWWEPADDAGTSPRDDWHARQRQLDAGV
ncbi:hypothetical protein ACGFIF_42940 [Kribbella sp. NPDC049174]|uniref:hypothetical protein n=1 Tax=Kribbella sp. NPDC049174 TaxID=3364112 RepID=UPI003711E316